MIMLIFGLLPPIEGKTVLEFGAGIGRFTTELAQKAGQLIAVDFIDSVIKKLDLRKPETEIKPLQLDEDLPGMGQFYCLHCDVKIMNEPAQHSQLDADLAAGMGMPNNGLKLMAA